MKRLEPKKKPIQEEEIPDFEFDETIDSELLDEPNEFWGNDEEWENRDSYYDEYE